MWQGTCGVTMRVGERRERLGRVVARLDLEPRPVDGRPVEPRRRAGLQPAEREAGRVQRIRQFDRRLVADPAGRRALFAEMDHPLEEGAGGDDQRRAGQLPAVGEFEAADRAVVDDEAARLGFDHRQVLGLDDQPLHRQAIELAVGLGARPLHRRTLAAVEDAELDAGGVGGAAHQAVERVDLAHQVALAEPADRRIAAHHADRLEALGDQRGARADRAPPPPPPRSRHGRRR